MKILFTIARPLFTPSATVTRVTAHTTRIGKNSDGTKSKPKPGASATCRNCSYRKAFGSLPQTWLMLKRVYIPAQPMMAA